MNDLTKIEACVFDAYGTLFDVASAAKQCREDLGEKWAQLATLWRDKQLQYAWLRTQMAEYISFWQITQDALDYALETLSINNAELRSSLLNIYFRLEAFPEVYKTLEDLKKFGMRSIILSNGSSDMLSAATKNSGINHLLDGTFSVDTIRVFKPHPDTYKLAHANLNIAADQICFLSSNAWDACAANHYGFQVFWVNRLKQVKEYLPGNNLEELECLSQLPKLIREKY